MDVASSAVSLIQFTITGLAFIRQTISSLKDGPKTVSHVAKSAHDLLYILQRLGNNSAVKKSQNVVLRDMLKSCHDDVTRMAEELDKCNFKATDKTGLKLWRSGKSVYKEKEWTDFRARLHGYSSALSIFITIEDSEKLFDIDHKMDHAHKLIQDELIRISDKCTRIENKYEEVGVAARCPPLQYTLVSLPNLPLQALEAGVATKTNTPQMAIGRRDLKNRMDLTHLGSALAYIYLDERQWTVEQVISNSRYLEEFFSHDRIILTSSSTKPATANKQTLNRVLRWSRAKSPSQTLWIKGPYTPTRDSENQMTRIGLKLVNLAHENRSNVQMISYFCQLRPANNLQVKETAETEALTSVIYALIRQIIEILQLPLENYIDLTETRFQCLNGTKGAWKEALVLLEELVNNITEPVFCILDGLQCLEYTSTETHLMKLLEVLRHKHLHVLYITTGTSACLGNTIAKDEILGEQDLRAGAIKEDLGRHGQKFWE